MNILIFSQYFFPENFRINDIAKNLVRSGHQVTVLTGLPNYPEGKYYDGYGFFKKNIIEKYEGVKIIRCRIYPRKNASKINLFLNYISYAISSSLRVLKFKKYNFDVSLVYAISPITVALPAILLKKISNTTPVVTWVQDLWPESVVAASGLNNRLVIKSINLLVKYIYKESNRILISSEGMNESILRKNTNSSKIFHLPQWAESVFEKNLIRKNLNVSFPKGFKIVFAGNIGKAQDIPSILKCAEILRQYLDIHFIFIGSGSMHTKLAKYIKKNKLENTIHLYGSFELEDMPYFYTNSDALLISLGNDPIWSITVPGKVQSCLAAGKPILTMLNGESNKIIKEAKAGLVANSGDYVQLSKNILFYKFSSEKYRLNVGENGRKYYEKNYKKEILMEKLEKLLSIND